MEPRSVGSLSEVGTLPPHNSDIPHRPMARKTTKQQQHRRKKYIYMMMEPAFKKKNYTKKYRRNMVGYGSNSYVYFSTEYYRTVKRSRKT